MYPQEVEEDDDPFEGEDELLALQELIDTVGSSYDAEVFISAEDSINVCTGNIDKTNPNWRNDLREQILMTRMLSYLPQPKNKTINEEEEEEEDEFDPELKQPVIDGTKGRGSG